MYSLKGKKPVEEFELPNGEIVEVYRSPLGYPVTVHYDLDGNIKNVNVGR